MVVVIMGVSGSGKTTVGSALAEAIHGRFVDADDFHPTANIDKMRAGQPLTDVDRAPWLRELRAHIDAWLDDQAVVVLACSALTEKAREILGTTREGVKLIFLKGSKALIEARMRERDHFMPTNLLESQLATLEPPEQALELDVNEPPDALVTRIRRHLSG